MKRFLSLALLVVSIALVFVVVTSAASSTTYWVIDSNCLVKAKTLADGTVPTFKTVDGDLDGLLVGVPTNAKYGDAFFKAGENYSIKYFDKNGKQITNSGTHIGTGEVIKVYDSNGAEVAQYGIVTYGDADGDGVFDVIDAYIAGLCLNGFIAPSEDPAVYEAVKPRVDADNGVVDVLDYQQIVNDAISDNLTENKKGRKIPIDDALNFDSIIYACDSKAKVASVTAADSRFKDIISIKYNGSATAPSSPGIYSVTAEVPSNTDYLVTPGKRELGFIVIAPKNGTGYTTIVDNANKKITIDVTKPNATGADLTGYINSWINPAYNLVVSSKNVASSTELASAMNYTTYKYYKTTSNKVSITDKTIVNTTDNSNAMLGCYLPDDNTLWTDNTAAKTIPVSVIAGDEKFDYTISFKQNEKNVEKLKETLLMGAARAAGARGQRSKDPATGASMTKSLFVECKRRYTAETGAYENITRIAYYVPSISFLELSMALSIPSTGFKTILLGDVDTIGFMAANQKSQFTAVTDDNITLLYDTTKENLRFSGYTTETAANSEDIIMDLVDKVLSGMNLNIKVSTSTKPSELGGRSGWCRYVCADDSTGLRYTTDYLLEFAKIDSTQDKHRTLLVKEVEGCTITTDPSQAITQKKDSDGNVTEEYYLRERMTQYEVFRVNATLKEGYKLSVKDANGNDVPYEAEHDWYIMPASDVTVTAVPQ